MAPTPADPSPDLHPGNRSLTRACLVAMVVGCYFSIAAMHILMGLAFVSWVSSSLPASRHPLRAPLIWPMAGYLTVSAISALLAWNPTSTREAFGFAMPLLVYVMTRDAMAGPRLVNRSVQYVIWGGVLAASFGLAQSHYAAQGFRISGSLSHYMTFSGVLLLALMLILPRALFGASKRERIPLAAGAAMILWALVMTKTRGAWVGMVAGSVSLLSLWKPKALFVLPLVLAGTYFLAPAHIQDRIRSTVDSTDDTINERLVWWNNGLKIIAANPVLGVGPRMVRNVYDEYRDPNEEIADKRVPGHLHNNVIQIAADRGLLGLGFWLAIWIGWFVRVGRSYRRLDKEDRSTRAVIAGCLSAMVAFQVMGLFEYNMGDSEVAFLALFVFALPLAIEAYAEE